MTSYTPSLRLAEPVPGDPAVSNVWGTILNTNFTLLESAITDLVVVNIAGLTNYTLTTANGAADQARPLVQQYTGVLIANCTVTLPSVPKIGWAFNNTTGGFSVILTTGSGTTITLIPNTWTFFYCDGTNVSTPAVGFGQLMTATNVTIPNTQYYSGETTAGIPFPLIGMASNNCTTLTVGTGGFLSVINSTFSSATMTIDNVGNVIANGGMTSIGQDSGGANFRAVNSTYGVFLKNDNTTAYLMQTAAGSPYGSYNNYRPFSWNLSDGAVTIDQTAQGTNILGYLYVGNAMGVIGQAALGGTNTDPIGNLAGNWVFNTGGAGSGYSTSSTATLTLGTSATNLVIFRYGFGSVGSITTNGGSTSYNTTSDQTLKIDDGLITDIGGIIDRLKPRWFRWKSNPDGISEPGFFAQQLHRVFPWAVTKSAGKKNPWQTDVSKLIPVLVAEIQQLRKRVAALEKHV